MTKKIKYWISINCFFILGFNPVWLYGDVPNPDSLENIVQSEAHDSIKIVALQNLSLYYIHQNTDKAAAKALQMFQMAEKSGNLTSKAEALRLMAACDHRMGNFARAVEQFKKAAAWFAQLNNLEGYSATLSNLGSSYLNLGQTDSAIKYQLKALDLFDQLGLEQKAAASLNNLGGIYINRGDYSMALQMFLKSLKIKEKLNDPIGIANTLNNIGMLYDSWQKNQEALNYYNKALSKYSELSHLKGIANTSNNIGVVFKNQGEYKKALEAYKISLKTETELKNSNGQAYTHTNMAEVFVKMNQPSQALNHLKTAFLLFSQTGDENGLSGCLGSLGNLHLNLKQNAEAVATFSQMLNLANKTENMELKKEACYGLYSASKNSGNLAKALKWHEDYTLYKDTLLNEKSTNQLNELKVIYETEKKQAEITLLNQQKVVDDAIISRKTSQTRMLIYGLCLFFIFVLIVLWLYRLKQNANRLLKIKNAEISRQRDDLELLNQELVQQKEEITAQRDEIEQQRNLITGKNKKIIESLRYAQSIQQAILPHPKDFAPMAGEAFVLFIPKDIVSGDFYWIDKHENTCYFAAIDCTGHGVPGAFMSMVAYNLLNQAFHELSNPGPAVLMNYLNKKFIANYRKPNQNNQLSDSMDMVLCAFDLQTYTLKFTGNSSSFVRIKDKKCEQFKLPRVMMGNAGNIFTEQTIELAKGDKVYFFTDGFADQFGGPAHKKFMTGNFIRLIEENHSLPMKLQKEILEKTFLQWKLDYEQVDDLMVIGMEIAGMD